MDIYLPIAELSANVLVLLGVGAGVGILSGVFGVGGGFLLTPMLLFLGIPAPVAVASGANQVVGASVSGVIAHFERGNVDVKMGLILLVGGLAGSGLGVWLFALLKAIGQIDLVISISYVVMLVVIGVLMLIEGVGTVLKRRRTGGTSTSRGPGRHTWMHRLPFKVRFRKSMLYISALLPLGIGFFVGVLSAIMGVGGGFAMVPAMIYLLGMPTRVVVGTSLFQVTFVTANVTVLQAVHTRTVDVVLAMLLLIGGVIGAQVGVRLGAKLAAEQLRILLALLVIGVGAKMTMDLVTTPEDLYSSVTVAPVATPTPEPGIEAPKKPMVPGAS
ncbi:MAG TPA: sulfite exporter TauE/SafE family protein, partial [Rhodospirillales bacterium]|nr:sulfite exporter TauE/SafE family protein [Rhodospirillales bacterium]